MLGSCWSVCVTLVATILVSSVAAQKPANQSASATVPRAQVEIGKFYHIQSADGSLLTIGGDNSRGIKVVTEVGRRGTEPRQKFVLGRGASHEIKPQQQNALSNLMLDLDVPSGLVYQQPRYYRRNQWWWVKSVENSDKFIIQNTGNGACMTSDGINTQVYAKICSTSNANQTWAFIPAA